jgi:hypothetical protein
MQVGVFTPCHQVDSNTIYRCIKVEELDKWQANTNFEFLNKTSNFFLHPHVEKYHLLLFQRLTKEENRKVSLPRLISQAHSGATSTIAPLAALGWAQFNKATFHHYLLNFVVTDDQISFYLIKFLSKVLTFYSKAINVVECWEFRVLMLLLQSELEEEMIPYCIKLHNSLSWPDSTILKVWGRSFRYLSFNQYAFSY